MERRIPKTPPRHISQATSARVATPPRFTPPRMTPPRKSSSGQTPTTPGSKTPVKRPHLFSSPRRSYSDRFIPLRNSSSSWDTNLNNPATPDGNENQQNDNGSSNGNNVNEQVSHEDDFRVSDPVKQTYNILLQNELLGNSPSGKKELLRDTLSSPGVLQYRRPGAVFRDSAYSLSPIGQQSQKLLTSPRKAPRKISKIPFKVLDAPELQDDYYLNLVDWSQQNILAVGLGNCVYLWSACTSQVTKLCDLRSQDDSVTSVGWIGRGTHLAVGTMSGELQIWDTHKCKKIRTMTGHTARVGTISAKSCLLLSGSRDRTILYRDARTPEHYIGTLAGHKQEVCGVRWSPDKPLVASGGNDNRLYVWDVNNFGNGPCLRFTDHKAAVKALAWSPHQSGLLVSGGGTADRRIRFWSTLTGQALQCIDTGSQVCNLAWSKTGNELVSTHGYSQNQIVVWKYPSMTHIAKLTGHTYRVLYLAMSPCGQTIVTGAGDETLRFWNVFDKHSSPSESRSMLTPFTHIR